MKLEDMSFTDMMNDMRNEYDDDDDGVRYAKLFTLTYSFYIIYYFLILFYI